MPRPPHPNKGLPPSGDTTGSTERQDTLLLSDIPDPSALIAEVAAPPLDIPSLNTAALAALGQRYDILGEAGHGSMGNVYKARDRETGETVALKILKPEIASDQAMMERFKNELLFARKITHKNVCRVHEFNRIGGIAYTSMVFVEGESLRSVLNRFGGLPPRKGMDLALQICSGLKEAHAQGIVHRDLKPENVMIDARGNVKIMDFGIARSMEALTRLTGSMVGTPAYMAPEQVAGKPVDYRTDVYSLGLILYEVFTGTQAFQADNAVAVALKQMQELPAPPHQIEPAIPVLIERAILKCLEKEPAKRFQSIAELENALGSWAAPGLSAVSTGVASPQPSRITTAHVSVPPPAEPESRRTSPIVWILVGALIVLGVFGGSRWAVIAQSVQQIPPAVPLPAPKPPDFALDSSGAQPAPQPADAPSAEIKQPDAQPVAPAAANPPVASESRPPAAAVVASAGGVAPAKKSANHPASKLAPEDVQQRAAKALRETDTVLDTSSFTYLWVGRFQREDRARAAAKKIQDLGLPAVVIRRRNDNAAFFIVFTGPFDPNRIPSVTEWLQSQGFPSVRPVAGPTANPNAKQNSNP